MLFAAPWASAQDMAPLPSPAGVETIHSAKATLLGLSYSYERALTSRATLNTELMKFFVTETAADLPHSKDNFIFAVASVDAEGHESLPVTPKVVR